MSPKQYPVIDAQSAIKNHNKQMEGMKSIEARMNPIKLEELPPTEGEATLDDYLAANGMPNSFSIKASLAAKVGISNYSGTPAQDKMIMKALDMMNTKETEKGNMDNENKNKDREFGLKEKELSLKEKEIEGKKMPDASSIADQLMSKFNQ